MLDLCILCEFKLGKLRRGRKTILRRPAGFLSYVPANQCGVSRRLWETGLRLVKPWKLEYPEKNAYRKTKNQLRRSIYV